MCFRVGTRREPGDKEDDPSSDSRVVRAGGVLRLCKVRKSRKDRAVQHDQRC